MGRGGKDEIPQCGAPSVLSLIESTGVIISAPRLKTIHVCPPTCRLVFGYLNRTSQDASSFTPKSDRRGSVEQSADWWARHRSLVFGCWSARRDRKHFCFSTNVPRTMGTDILGLFPGRDCCFLPKLRCLFRGLAACLANRTDRRGRLPCLCSMRAVFAICYCSWLCHARTLGSIPLLVRFFICRRVDNGYSAGLRHLLLDLRFCRCRLSHAQRHGVAGRGQVRSLLLATSHVISQ